MISIVLKQGSDYAAFENSLKQHNYKFQKNFKRIFFVDSSMSDFLFKSHAGIESIEPQRVFDLKPQAIESNITLRYGSGVELNRMTWAKHRIIRRSNLFKRESPSLQKVFNNLNYQCARDGTGVDVYIMDVGMDTGHKEFATGITDIDTGQTEFYHSPGQTHGLGTTACATGVNIGIAPSASRFFKLIAFAHVTDADFLNVLEDVYNHYMSRSGTNRPAVINASWASIDVAGSSAVLAGYDAIISAGLILCTAAGNSKENLDIVHVSPSEAHPDIIAVGATDCYDRPMFGKKGDLGIDQGDDYISATGDAVKIYAPGHVVPYPIPETVDQYALTSGTSFASPYVAGVIACMLQGYQRLTSKAQVQAVIQRMIDNSTKGVLEFDSYYQNTIIHNRLLYLDPFKTIEGIPELTPL